MTHKFIENGDGRARVYDSIVIDPRKLNIFGSELAVRIVTTLAKNQGCAMDLARSLGEHEQKIYYHLRRLEEAGVIRKIRTEKRYAMTAKIYGLVSPTVTAKLHEDGYEEMSDNPKEINPRLEAFFHPFVNHGTLDARIIIGDTYSHGKYDMGSTEGPYVMDFMMLLGGLARNISFPARKLDTEVHEKELTGNLILLGNAQTNTVIDNMNGKLPVRFDSTDVWGLVSERTGRKYTDPRTGLIAKIDNPLNPEKKVLIIGGVGRRGTYSAVLALTKHLDMIKEEKGNVVHIVCGYDQDSDRVIDTVKFLE